MLFRSATAGDSNAYGLYAGGDMTVGDIGSNASITARADSNFAYGLYAGGNITTGNISGTITATAKGNEAAGLYSHGYITTDAITGTIDANASGSGAYGLRALYIEIRGDIGIGNNALIRATAGLDYAYGLEATACHTFIGDIDGNVIATAGRNYAYGLADIYYIGTGDINGHITATADGNYAYGLYVSDGSIKTGAISGDINATATTGDWAYGLYARSGRIDTGAISGTITATAGRSGAYGLYADDDINVGGDISGTITATAGADVAFGLYSGGSITTGVINGTITANAQGEEPLGGAYGLYAVDDINTGAINGTITAMTGDHDAYGMYAGGNLTINGDIGSDANISATATNSYAYGIYSYDGDINIGNIDVGGKITATAGGDEAAGLYSADGNIYTGDIGGTITATARGGPISAYGLYAKDSITTGAITGAISAEKTHGSGAYGLRGDVNVTTGDITGKITATALDSSNGYDAYGISAGNELTVNGNIGSDANISAQVGRNGAYGLYSGNNLSVVGDIDGAVHATAGHNGAYGLYSDDGSVTTGAINGTITADAGHHGAYGIYAYDDLTVNGDIGSTANINATADTADDGYSGAHALYSEEGDIIINGNIDGTITATAGANAYGLESSSGSINITGAINGTITATATTGSDAYGLAADSDIYTGDIGRNAVITATAEDDDAYGLAAHGSITTGAINGTISATANGGGGMGSAYGLAADGSINIEAINGTITANMPNGSDAYGIYAGSDLTVGNIGSGAAITATAGQNNAVALFSGSTLTTGAIGGTISAHAGGDYAYGILSYGRMDVTINGGTVSATLADDSEGTHVAAIQSGRIVGGVLGTPQLVDDTVTIVAGSKITGAIDLANYGTDNDTLNLTGSTGSTTLNSDIMNVEDINVTGGMWIVNGNVVNNLNGIMIPVDGGTLDGSGSLGDVTMYGGVIGGNRTINGNLNMHGGTISPGNSPGTIHIAGDLTLSPTSTYYVEVTNSEQADNVIVDGTADLNDATLHAAAFGGRITHSFDVNVLDATGALKGEFGSVTGSNLFLKFGVAYDYLSDPCLVILQVTHLPYTAFARTHNERSIGHAFDHIVLDGEDTGDMNTVLSAIEGLPDGRAVNKAYDQMMPQDVLGLPEVTRNMMNQFSEGVFDHIGSVQNSRQYAMMGDSSNLMASASDSPAVTPQIDKWMPYAKGFGTWGSHDGESDIAGYNYSTYGMMGGIDKWISENTLLGFGMGGAVTNVDYKQDSANADISSMLVSLYGSYFVDNWHVGLNLGYSHNWYDAKRGINFDSIDRDAKSSYQGNAYNIATELGNNFGGKSMLLEPVAGVGYTAVQQDSYRETGAKSLGLRVDSETTEGIYSKLGLRWAKEFRSEKNPDTVFVPKANVFWIHDFADGATFDSEFVNGGHFSTDSMDPVRDSFNFGAGLNVFLSKSTRLFVDYGWQGASSLSSSTLQAGAQWSF